MKRGDIIIIILGVIVILVPFTIGVVKGLLQWYEALLILVGCSILFLGGAKLKKWLLNGINEISRQDKK